MNANKFTEINNDLALNVLQQIPTPVMAVNRSLELIFMNQAGLDLVGTPWEEIRGVPCAEVFNSRHCGTEDCRMRRVIDGGRTITVRNEVTLRGRQIPIEYTAAALKDAEGNIVGGLEYILDISERVRQEKKLKEQSRTIMEISTPAIKLWDRIVILPVVGVV
ncbi:MAG: PAS domain-containing protein, partial [Desulfobacterales bacterium]|nr:PAS domain-containing protein [Desulfobacterales bacterium]